MVNQDQVFLSYCTSYPFAFGLVNRKWTGAGEFFLFVVHLSFIFLVLVYGFIFLSACKEQVIGFIGVSNSKLVVE